MGPKLVIGVNDLKSQNPQVYSELDFEELEKLDINPETISVRSHKKLPWICKECNNKWSADCSSRTNKKPSGCPKCGQLKRAESFKNNYLKIGINDLKSQNIKVYNELNFKELEKQGINPNKITFQNHKKYPFICSNCGNHWHTIISHRTNRIKPTGCPECGEIQRKKNFTRTTVKIGINDLESKLPEIINFWDYEKNYPVEPSKVTYRSDKKYWFRCLNGHESHLASCSSFYQGSRCPICKKSKGEEKLKKLFKQYNIKYIEEYTINQLTGIGGRKLRFDFYLPDYKLLIEYQGGQHYGIGIGWFKKIPITIKHDKFKRDYCKKNKIKLLRIPYTYFNKLEKIVLKIQHGTIPRLKQPQVKHAIH